VYSRPPYGMVAVIALSAIFVTFIGRPPDVGRNIRTPSATSAWPLVFWPDPNDALEVEEYVPWGAILSQTIVVPLSDM